MKRRQSTTEQQLQNHAAATAKVRMWEDRAYKARSAGRTADAERCDDKVRDWASKARQVEQSQKAGT